MKMWELKKKCRSHKFTAHNLPWEQVMPKLYILLWYWNLSQNIVLWRKYKVTFWKNTTFIIRDFLFIILYFALWTDTLIGTAHIDINNNNNNLYNIGTAHIDPHSSRNKYTCTHFKIKISTYLGLRFYQFKSSSIWYFKSQFLIHFLNGFG